MRLPFDDGASLAEIDAHTAAVVVEPVQAEAGVRIPSPAFLPALRRRCDETGALLVLDEVVTGFGRTGRLFAHQHWGVVPDLLVLAKALGGGLPLGAFVGSPAVMATLGHDPPLAHVTTFGGHPLSCAAGPPAPEGPPREDPPARAAGLGPPPPPRPPPPARPGGPPRRPSPHASSCRATRPRPGPRSRRLDARARSEPRRPRGRSADEACAAPGRPRRGRSRVGRKAPTLPLVRSVSAPAGCAAAATASIVPRNPALEPIAAGSYQPLSR